MKKKTEIPLYHIYIDLLNELQERLTQFRSFWSSCDSPVFCRLDLFVLSLLICEIGTMYITVIKIYHTMLALTILTLISSKKNLFVII